ncbi:hypothetical protein G5V59_13980 [Nocardioides sp. W3-2-3]|uniref:phosphopantetheine-binding protein n=1 Tax=Nocardioides convexus TaxID=2712224 RepID=UPI00241864F7|nr:phosphopantetheine-binding protein [Nocardioides convexus]NHA00734.1 hypothetical protein [Nocardioides convexus]
MATTPPARRPRTPSRLVVAVPGAPDPEALAEVAAEVAADTGLPPHAIRAAAVAELPRLANGKPDHAALARLHPEPAPEPVSLGDALARHYARVLGREVGPQDSFVSLGGDSLSYVELSLLLERRLGALPPDWQRRSVADLALLDPARRRRFARIDTTIPLRALAIVMIVGSHSNLWTLVGGAHVLLAVTGTNFARFHLTDEDSRQRLRRVGRAAARIAVPSILWIGLVSLVAGTYPLRTVLLLNDLLGGRGWSEPAWHFWFVEVVLMLAVGAGLLTSVPRVMALERRHRFGLAAGLTALALVPRWWATWSSYDGDVIHSSLFVGWLFLGGWAAAVARTTPQRLLAAGLLLLGTWDLTGDLQRDLTIAGGLLVLVGLPTVPWPRVLVGITGTLASASLLIYLTHWQVYPHLENRWPLGGLLASLAVGVLAWRLAEPAPRPGRTPAPPPLSLRSRPPHPTGSPMKKQAPPHRPGPRGPHPGRPAPRGVRR